MKPCCNRKILYRRGLTAGTPSTGLALCCVGCRTDFRKACRYKLSMMNLCLLVRWPFVGSAVLTLGLATPAWATPLLGAAQGFSVLGGSAVTNTGATTLVGDLGVYPGASITGGSTVTLTGTVHQGDAVAQQAQSDTATAVGMLNSQTATANLTGQDLGGMNLTPGVYDFDASAQLTGTLVLNYQNNANAVFVFRILQALTTASSAVVSIINGSANEGLFWQVGSSATLGSGTLFAGSLLADQSITLGTGAQILCGRAIALNAAVTMDTNTVSTVCPPDAPDASGGSVPEPAPLGLVALALGVLTWVRRRA